ncbi:MAG: Nif3-like dinuclear metal center hexameric protein [Proteobacteria bacterium]|nr:Nif3-like dinuclear metal center hexameric protein [Pseudomonadota bacterium]
MNINGILDVVRRHAPEEYAADWDNCGISVLGSVEEVGRVAVALDPTPDFVREALAWGAGLIVTHHPLYFDPVAPNRDGRYLDVLRMVLGAGCWLYGAHTSLDCRPDGPASWLGRALGLQDARVLEPVEAGSAVGYGQMGRLPAPLDWAAFTDLLGSCIDREVWAEVGVRPATVSTVAYLPGSGSSAMTAAALAGADVFITGDLKYHQALEAPLCTLDVGHFSLEEEMTRLFAAELESALEGVEVTFFPSVDPFRFSAIVR